MEDSEKVSKGKTYMLQRGSHKRIVFKELSEIENRIIKIKISPKALKINSREFPKREQKETENTKEKDTRCGKITQEA